MKKILVIIFIVVTATEQCYDIGELTQNNNHVCKLIIVITFILI